MYKKILFSVLLVVCFKFSWSQQLVSDKKISALYAAPIGQTFNPDTINYYLVKVLNPAVIDLKKTRVVKRISYNFYVIASVAPIPRGGNIVTATPANALWKASDNLLQLWQKHAYSKHMVEIDVSLNSNAKPNDIKKFGAITAANGNVVKLKIAFNQLQQVLQQPYVTFANQVREAHEELAITDIDLGANSISAIKESYPGITGDGIKVCVKENRYDKDLDLLGRSFDSFPASATTSGHATIMATLIGGNGNSFIKGLGAAPAVRFTSSDFKSLFPDSTATFKAYHISIQNHSYGTGIENYYGAEAAAYDKQVVENDSITHVFSSGNIGTKAPATGVYNGLTGSANLSGDFKQAKNVLVIGGTGRTNQSEDLSSAGPAYDGRVKPELVADGEDGTSGAAALVSGTVALLQQAYKLQFGQLPSAALLKSVLINSADDIGNAAVDYKTGYGKLNALEALRTIKDNRFIKGAVTAGQQNDFIISIPANCRELKVSLAWNDVPAQLNAPVALVNDLDLFVTTPDGKNILPWTLSSYPAIDSLQKPAQRKRDTLNNAEQVTIADPSAGTYVLHVKGSKVPSGSQNFYLAYQSVIADQFEWIYPSDVDQLFAGDDNYLRWQSSFNVATGILSVSYNHGSTWQVLNAVVLKNSYYVWTAPDLFTTAQFKMDINGTVHLSKEFSISKPLALNVGYNCTDGTLLHWSPQEGSTGYEIYTIKDNLLQKFRFTTDTTLIIPAQDQSSAYFAVSALGNGFEGLKSYTIDVSTQGVGCYVKTLLATVAGNKVLLDLDLGSVVNLKTITWEKMTGANTFTAIGTSDITGGQLSYQFTDATPKEVQYYRARLTTLDNKPIYSDLARAVVLQSKQFAVFPNPVTTEVTILSGDINNYELKLYDASGRLRMNNLLNNLQNTLPVSLNTGIYVYTITLSGRVVYQGKMIKL
jgi:hypothetical protein